MRDRYKVKFIDGKYVVRKNGVKVFENTDLVKALTYYNDKNSQNYQQASK